MEVNYAYTTKRSNFGHHCALDDIPVQMLDNIPTTTDFDSEFVPRNPVYTTLDTNKEVAEHECNTALVRSRVQSMRHFEGGWPDNLDATEPEQVDRYLKKQSKEPAVKASVKELAGRVEDCVKQNNTLDIYERYFEGSDELSLTSEPPSMKNVAVFRDPSPVKRTVTAVNFNPDGNLTAVAYSVLRFQDSDAMSNPAFSPNSHVWDVNATILPLATLAVPSPLVSIRFNVKTPDILCGGSYNGMVHVFDIKKPRSVAISSSPIDKSHFDPVYDVFWIQSKTNNQFVSCSTDGRMLWWDTRKLSEPTDELFLADGGRTLGGSSMDYNIEAGPAKYLVGTEQGVVMSMNMRKVKAAAAGTKADNSGAVSAMDTGAGKHHGPIYSIQRNPMHPINYMTVGDWSIRIWSEKNKTPILTMPYSKSYLTWGAWSQSRAGVFFVTRNDGVLDAWDLFYRQNAPAYSHRVSVAPLSTVAVQPGGGKMLAVGDVTGTVTLLEMSENLTIPPPSEKMAMGLAFERESKREETLEKRAMALARARKAGGGGGVGSESSAGSGSPGGGAMRRSSVGGAATSSSDGSMSPQPVGAMEEGGGNSTVRLQAMVASGGGGGGGEEEEVEIAKLEQDFLGKTRGDISLGVPSSSKGGEGGGEDSKEEGKE